MIEQIESALALTRYLINAYVDQKVSYLFGNLVLKEIIMEDDDTCIVVGWFGAKNVDELFGQDGYDAIKEFVDVYTKYRHFIERRHFKRVDFLTKSKKIT